jgi:DNA-binding NarL/FixJ family response regulator
MTDQRLRAALISTDPAFQDQARHHLADPESGVELALEFPVGFGEFDETQVEHLRKAVPDVVIVDLQDDPDLGIKFVQFLNDTSSFRVIAVGPTLEPQMLLGAMRAGIGDYLPKPVTHEAMAEALGRITNQLGRQTDLTRKPW